MQKDNEKSCAPEEQYKSSSSNYLMLLKLLDILMSSIVIAPCVIAYWRGTWQLFELLLLPQDSGKSALISFALGSFGHLFFTLCQDSFKKLFDPDKKRLTYYFASRCYTAVFGIVCVNMWRGAWNLCDYLTSKTSLGIIMLTTLLALIALVVIRTTRNLTAAPFAVTVDHSKMYFEITTMFNTKKYRRPFLYLLDTFFSVIVVGTLVVIAWRGVWQSLDLTFYCDNEYKSAVGSLETMLPYISRGLTKSNTKAYQGEDIEPDALLLTYSLILPFASVLSVKIIGYGIVGVTFALQPIWRRICNHVSGTLKLVLADSYYLISFVGAVNVWRGFWILLDVYLYPENQLKSYYVSHAISYIILTVLNCANSILVRGIAIDGEEEDDSCVEFSIAYIKLHMQTKRRRKYIEINREIGDKKLKEQQLLMQSRNL